MPRKPDPEKLLFEVVQTKGDNFIDLPYSEEFEKVCQAFKPSPSTEDKRTVWQRVIDRVQGERTDEHGQSDPLPEQRSPSSGSQGQQPTAPIRRAADAKKDWAPYLFENEPDIDDAEPWTSPTEDDLTEKERAKRQRILADIANSDLAHKEQRIAHILSRYPETRDSDTALCLRYWRMFQADVILEWDPLQLEVLYDLDRIETIGRIRRELQNELHLFRATEETKRIREAQQSEFYEYLSAHRDALAEVRFYLDETGADSTSIATGVGGVCAMNWKQWELHHAAMEQWRLEQGWPETIHFSDTGLFKLDRAVMLLQQLRLRRAGLLFVGYAVQSRGRTSDEIMSLYAQLIVDSLRHMRVNGCLNEPRSIHIVKEASSGFDSVYLEKLKKQVADLVAVEFPGNLVVSSVEAVNKGRTVMLECADLIAAGMRRRSLFKGRDPKDVLAEAMINVTGFEDSADTGALFKSFPFV